MKMNRGLIIFLAGASLMTASCTESQDKVFSTPGMDVSFSANLDGNKTRTVYGEEKNNGIKVNWVEGDKIKVYGTTCSNGRQLAEYSVNTSGATDQNYATSLDKTGDAGVQWGKEATSDFYAVYPSSNNGKDFTIASNNDGSVTISASIRRDQRNIFSLSNNTWVSSPYGTDENVLSMPDAVMYAVTKDVHSGEKVDLNFQPFSTVLKFKIGGYSTNLTDPTLHISEVTITAPEGVMISGDFHLTIASDGTKTVSPSSNASNQINLYPTQKGGAYAPIKKGQAMEFSVFVIPQEGMSIDENWTFKIYTDGGNFTKKLKPTNAESASLIAGQIHKLDIKGTTIKEDPQFDPSKWISQIPRNVYLSELSLPGAWYCYDKRYQDATYTSNSYETADIATQYTNGVRGFHIDCRLAYENVWGVTWSNPSGNLKLVCAGTENWTSKVGRTNTLTGDFVLDRLQDIAKQIRDDEYVVTVLTIAEKPKITETGIITTTYGSVEPEKVLQSIADMLSNSDNIKNLKLYTGEIKPETTVNEVLGHMIVKVNANTDAEKFLNYTYSSIPNALLSKGSMAPSDDGDIKVGYFDQMLDEPMYMWNDKAGTGVTFYYHQAQETETSTSGVPTYEKRELAINDIVKKSQVIYNSELMNGWYQIGIGGYTKTSGNDDRQAVAKKLNPILYKLVEDKLNSTAGTDLRPSPVGIVLMNYCTSTSDDYGNGAALVDAILQMNGKFYLNRDPNGKEWTTEGSDIPVQSAKKGYSSGFNVDTENWKAF